LNTIVTAAGQAVRFGALYAARGEKVTAVLAVAAATEQQLDPAPCFAKG
jgi:hypothetical protein